MNFITNIFNKTWILPSVETALGGKGCLHARQRVLFFVEMFFLLSAVSTKKSKIWLQSCSTTKKRSLRWWALWSINQLYSNLFGFLFITHKSPSENDLVFHFFGVESDSIRVREAINKMVEKGRIGNFSLVSTHYALHQEPGLMLQVRAIHFLYYFHFINVITPFAK